MPISIKPMNNFSVIVSNDTRLKTKSVLLIVLAKPVLLCEKKSSVHCTVHSTPLLIGHKKGYNSCVF